MSPKDGAPTLVVSWLNLQGTLGNTTKLHYISICSPEACLHCKASLKTREISPYKCKGTQDLKQGQEQIF